MDCAEVRDRLKKGNVAPGPELDAHAARCSACRALLEDQGVLARRLDLASATAAAPDLESLYRAVDGRLASERGVLAWIRSRPTSVLRTVTLLSAIPLAVYLYTTYGFRQDREFWPVSRLCAIELAFALGALGLIWVATRPFHRRQLSPSALRSFAAIGVFLAFAIAALPLPHAVDPHTLPGDPVPATWYCYVWGLSMGSPVLVVALLLCREASLARALALATAAGLISNLEIQLECPATARGHMLASHATVSLTFVALVILVASLLWIVGRLRATPAASNQGS
jgi:hypothetical protein